MRSANTRPTALLCPAALCALLLLAAACASEEPPPTTEDAFGEQADPASGESRPDAASPDTPDACPPGSPDAPALRFIDARSYFQTPEAIDAWFALLRALRSDFDAVCGDTFCEGEFSNYESLRFRCSVEETTGIIGGCVWVLGASNEEIESATGAVTVEGQIFACDMPIAAGTDVADFVAALSAPGVEPIRALLPGSDQSLFDGLADCL